MGFGTPHKLEDYVEITKRLNREAYEFYRSYPDFYTPGIHVHPAFVDLSCGEIEKYSALGVKLVGELVPYLMCWSGYNDDGLFDILAVARDKGMVVNIHLMKIDTIFDLMANLPDLKLVVAHLDGYGCYNEQIELMKKYENVYFDISAHGATRKGMLRETIDAVGKDRILLGSDYPGYKADPFIATVMDNSITDDEREAVLYRNAENLLGVKVPD